MLSQAMERSMSDVAPKVEPLTNFMGGSTQSIGAFSTTPTSHSRTETSTTTTPSAAAMVGKTHREIQSSLYSKPTGKRHVVRAKKDFINKHGGAQWEALDKIESAIKRGFKGKRMRRKQDEELDLSLLITPTVFSFFDGKLTPKRSEMLVLGYCASHGYIEMTLDLIRIVILFFNPLLYWTIRFDHVCHYTSIIRRRPRFDFRSWSWGITVDFLPGTITDITDTIQYGFRNCSHASNYGNIFPSQDEFNISLTVNKICYKNVVYAKVNSKYDDIQLIVIRIRIFCVENEQEIEKILVTKNNEEHKICSYSQDIDDNLDYLAIDNESMVGKNIGFDADIQHILYADGNYWCKDPYSWFCDVIDGHAFVRDGLSQTHLNYFNSRCFKINDTYYYLCDSGTSKNNFYSFACHYCPTFMQFPYDISLLDARDTGICCTSTLLSVFYNLWAYSLHKLEQEHLQIKARETAMTKALKRGVNMKQSQHKKKKQWNQSGNYRNKKHKYKYHRW
eukprot:999341_1